MRLLPRGSILSFEGGILLSISLGLAVRIFWSDLEKSPKSASGKILGATFWVGDLFAVKKVFRKTWFCGGMVLWWGFRGIHPAQMNSMVPRTHMGKLLCPKTPLNNNFYANSTKSRKFVQAPVPSLWPSLFPLGGLLFYTKPLAIMPSAMCRAVTSTWR